MDSGQLQAWHGGLSCSVWGAVCGSRHTGDLVNVRRVCFRRAETAHTLRGPVPAHRIIVMEMLKMSADTAPLGLLSICFDDDLEDSAVSALYQVQRSVASDAHSGICVRESDCGSC